MCFTYLRVNREFELISKFKPLSKETPSLKHLSYAWYEWQIIGMRVTRWLLYFSGEIILQEFQRVSLPILLEQQEILSVTLMTLMTFFAECAINLKSVFDRRVYSFSAIAILELS